MRTLKEIEAEIRLENPSLKLGNEKDGYTELNSDEYEATILDWTNRRYQKEKLVYEKETAKTDLLTKLGITAEEAALLLS
jgi:hypothetical protein